MPKSLKDTLSSCAKDFIGGIWTGMSPGYQTNKEVRKVGRKKRKEDQNKSKKCS
jgi:hypothetical protein